MEFLDSCAETFRSEAMELLLDIEQTALDLEDNPDDKESVHRIFRAVHTIKGSGAMFGFREVAEVAHHVETVLDEVRNENVPVTGKLINLIVSSHDLIKMMIHSPDGETPDIITARKTLIESLNRLLPANGLKDDGSGGGKHSPGSSGNGENGTFHIRFRPIFEIFSTGMNPLLLLEELGELGKCTVTAHTGAIPPLSELSPDLCYFSWDILLVTGRNENEIKDVFIFLEDGQIDVKEISGPAVETPPSPLLRQDGLPAEAVPAASDPEEAAEISKAAENRAGKSETISPAPLPPALPEAQTAGKQGKKKIEESIRVPSGKLDNLINLVGELVINQARLTQVAAGIRNTDLADPLETLERLTADLRDVSLGIRMLPMRATFSKLRRLVRDLSINLGKEAELITKGADTELDKHIIERLDDPLVHLIRNCMDHGIELPEQREKRGKPRKGAIRMTAAHRGSRVLISIRDDGRGIDPAEIREAAEKKGMIPKDAKLSEPEIFDLIFAPGLSTTGKVTSVSGRGVGMDVVKRSILSMGGSVEIESKKGLGTIFHLYLPLTLAIIDGLLVNSGGRRFIIPVEHIDGCTELTREEVDKNSVRHMIRVMDEWIPFFHLGSLFGTTGQRPGFEHMVIVNNNGFHVGIIADEIIETMHAVLKPLDKFYQDSPGISGATIMGDGGIALIIDVPGLIERAKQNEILNYRNKGIHS